MITQAKWHNKDFNIDSSQLAEFSIAADNSRSRLLVAEIGSVHSDVEM